MSTDVLAHIVSREAWSLTLATTTSTPSIPDATRGKRGNKSLQDAQPTLPTQQTHTKHHKHTYIPESLHTDTSPAFYSSSTVNSGLAPNSWPVLHYGMLWGCALLIGLLLNSNTECKNMARITQCEAHAGDRGCKSVYEPNFMHDVTTCMHLPDTSSLSPRSFPQLPISETSPLRSVDGIPPQLQTSR